MVPRRIRDGIEWVGAVDWDRRTFDELVALPDGTSYNAYLVRGSSKTALFDTVDPTMGGELAERLSALESLDYVVCHHAEQDHSGCLPWVLDRFPTAEVLTSRKGKGLLLDAVHVPEDRIRVVEDGETLDLGGRTAEFWMMPWVHWPETFASFIREDRVLLSCDLFGSHLATSDLFAVDEPRVLRAAKLYYAQIMMPFAPMIAKHLERIGPRDIDAILPSHGPAWGRPRAILDAYRTWVQAPPVNLAVVAYVSMHGSTRVLVDRLVAGLAERDVEVRRFDLTRGDPGPLATALVDASTLVLATPTVLNGAHPTVAATASLVGQLKPKVKWLSVVGSYGWSGGKAGEQLQSLLSGLKAEWLPQVSVRSLPRPEDLDSIDALADAIAQRHLPAVP